MSEPTTAPSAPTAPLPTLEPVTPGWTLPASYYLDERVHAAELATVFTDTWLFAGHACEVAEPGQYLLFEIGDDSVIVVRDADGVLHAHHNVCRHRGSRICDEPRGRVRALMCPYHQWTYGLDGRLRGARLMGEGFAKDGVRLGAVAVRELAGLVFVSLADAPPSFDAMAAAVTAQLGHHRLDRARVAHRASYSVRANWKTLVENNRECYHCRSNHPEFLESNFEFGSHGDPRRNDTYDDTLAAAYARWRADGLEPADVSFPGDEGFRVSRLPLRDGFVTETMDGAPVAPPMGQVGGSPGSLRLITLPTMWAHANLDYAMTTRLTPVGADRTDVDVCFLVDADASDDDVDLERLTTVWTATSEQDWALCEANAAGIRSRGYLPGPLSPVVEASVQHFVDWYLRRLTGSRTPRTSATSA
ncbi:SRPBCC family protein [Nocardioides sp. CFH 31398]|uniref:aromatic ring-hydroxylating oxygenase subunit alpha n=1 Tax=Nocardioides sp. CFH 31398 TaxID=2919579 RepID=UPI001F05156E|nr:aromatic ring-hydroxylating dioxygenase subunit alpha [Nocardioides sp. CFH 31398]MCH1866380.1 aromatic ring-hydroxylating dioxygenase subunit alpha [Nocardioides sp. CFH 31398]